MTPEQIASALEDYLAQRDVYVQYQDVANPMRVGMIVEHIAGEFRIWWEDDQSGEVGGDRWTDLRQPGWAIATIGSRLESQMRVAAGASVDRHSVGHDRLGRTAQQFVPKKAAEVLQTKIEIWQSRLDYARSVRDTARTAECERAVDDLTRLLQAEA